MEGCETVLCCMTNDGDRYAVSQRPQASKGPTEAVGRVQSSWTATSGSGFLFSLGGRTFLIAPQSVMPSAASTEYASAFFTTHLGTIGIRVDSAAFFATGETYRLASGSRVPAAVSIAAVTDPRARSIACLPVALEPHLAPHTPVQQVVRSEEAGRASLERGEVVKSDGLVACSGLQPAGPVTPLLNAAGEVVAVGAGGALFVPFPALLRQLGFAPPAADSARPAARRARSPSPAAAPVPQVDKDMVVYVGDGGTSAIAGKFHVREGCHGARRPMLMSEALAQRRLYCQSCQPYQGGSVLDELRALRDLFTTKDRREHRAKEPEVLETAGALRSSESPLRKSWKQRSAAAGQDPDDDDDAASGLSAAASLGLSESEKGRTTVFVGEGGRLRGAYHFRENCAGARRPVLLSTAEAEGRALCAVCAPRGRGELRAHSEGRGLGDRLLSLFA